MSLPDLFFSKFIVLPTCVNVIFIFLLFIFGCFPFRWLHGLIDTYSGVQPDTDEVHIPAGRKGDVKVWYDEELEAGNPDLIKVSKRQFNRVWLERLPHLKCRAFLRSPPSLKFLLFFSPGSQYAAPAPLLRTK